MIEAGQKAPPFTLQNQDDETVSLDDYEGRRVVLYFYPRDNTPGCTVEAIEFTAAKSKFDALALEPMAGLTQSGAGEVDRHDLVRECSDHRRSRTAIRCP